MGGGGVSSFMNHRQVVSQRGTLRARAADPGTPIAELAEIAHKFPALVLRNPAFELAAVADPGFLLAMPSRSWTALLQQDDFPPDVILWAAHRLRELRSRTPRIGQLIARHPNTPRAALDLMAGTPEEPIAMLHAGSRQAFARPWQQEVEAQLERWSSSNPKVGDLRVIAGIARNGLVDGGDPLVRALIAGSGDTVRNRYSAHQRNLPADVLHESVEQEVRRFQRLVEDAVSSRPLATAYDRERRRRRVEFCGELLPSDDPGALARSRRERDRARACMGLRGALPEDALRSLSQDRAWRVRAAVAFRPQLGQVESLWLAKDPDGRVREALAVTTSHAAVLEQLARDRSIDVRLAVAGNPASTPTVAAIVGDPEILRETILDAWVAGKPIDGSGRPLCRRDASDCWTAEECAMLALRESYNSLSRVLLLCSWRCPIEVLEDHLASQSWWVRLAVVRNPRTPWEELERVAATDWNWVLRAAAREALELRRTDPPVLPAPLDAAFVCERHMPSETRRRLTGARRRLRSEMWDDVHAAVEVFLSDPHARRVIAAGLLRSSRSVRACGLSEAMLRVADGFQARVLEMLDGGGVIGESCSDMDRLRIA